MVTKNVIVSLIAAAASAVGISTAQANVITFGANHATNSLFSAWVEDSITMTPIFDESSAGPPH